MANRSEIDEMRQLFVLFCGTAFSLSIGPCQLIQVVGLQHDTITWQKKIVFVSDHADSIQRHSTVVHLGFLTINLALSSYRAALEKQGIKMEQ